ncbi:MAG: hypothetical protein JNL14_01480 [Devosia sp.]|jgi:hypothetical protein|uniref:hypothetical protein n=1 Tax=Devosia sp. TaxID=1871048 RepID=UPI001A3A10EB|nr:hypothetical protein [Devosia sp.]MBL8596388.1 hypothetical protein [Devosia sp.]
MKRLALAALLALTATPSFAVPMCYAPRGGNVVIFEFEIGKMGETERAAFYEKKLRMRGIDARQTTFWNGCIQTNVRENGRISMRFYDPWSLEEIPVN